MGIGPVRDALTTVQTSRESLTYERFFGLKEKPFSLGSDPRFLYPSRSHAVAYDELLAGIRRREGLLVLTGEIGTGKTTLCRAVLRNLDRKTFSAFVPDPFASREDLLKMLLIEFGVMSIHDLATGHLKNASRTELNYLLSGFLDSLAPLEAFVVMFIDEAQNMAVPLIEEIRILSDTFGQKGQLQVVFVGQLELHDKLKLPEMRQVDQRVCVYCKLDPLTADAVTAYVQHRLEVAGGSPDRVTFAPEVFELLHRRSGGIPRVINRICDRALHLAYLKRTATVDLPTLEAALVDVGHIERAPVVAAASSRAPAPTDGFAASVDQWLTRTEAHPSNVGAPLDVFPPDMPTETPPEEPPVEPRVTITKTGWRDRDGKLRNQTYMQRLTRRWLARAAVAVVVFVTAKTAITVLTALPADWFLGAVVVPPVAEVPALRIPSLNAPALPDMDRGGTTRSGEFHVAVGLFTTEERALRLVAELTRAGLPAYQRAVQLPNRRVFRQVLLGPYLARADAQADLDKLRQLNGFGDANVIEIAVTGTTAGG
jgi:type II secretory pathway predicted ATPase ExeA